MTHDTDTEVGQGNTRLVRSTASLSSKGERNFCFTSFNDKIEFTMSMKYLIQGREICPKTQKEHYQGYVMFRNARTLSGVIKEYRPIHFEIARGSNEDNIKYCSKDGDFTEEGERPVGQGARTDKVSMVKLIKDGLDDRELIEEIGDQFIRNYKGIGVARAILSEIKRNWEMDVRIYHGEPGTGKTKAVWDEFDVEDVYVKSPGKWWDGYRGQKVILIDDFDPSTCFDITFDFYLKLLDRYPMRIEWKGGSGEFYSKVIIFTSNFDSEDWFISRRNRSAFFRRVNFIKCFNKNTNREMFEDRLAIERIEIEKQVNLLIDTSDWEKEEATEE